MLQARSPCRTLAKNLAISPPPPSRQGRHFPLCRGSPWFSLCVLRRSLLFGPVELGSVEPHPMQDDGQLACNSYLCFAEPICALRASSPNLLQAIYRSPKVPLGV